MTPPGYAEYQSRKRALIQALRGTVLEAGAGNGRNFADLHRDVSWIGLEPNGRRRRTLGSTARRHGQTREPLAARLEAVPMPDASVSAVLATVVLCSVTDQDLALAEIDRVLEPGGVFVFAEHVAAPRGTWKRAAQRTIAPFSRVLDSGCDPARDTMAALEASPLRLAEIDEFALPMLLGAAMPYVVGRAVKVS